jgi:uncharacterized membrane protein YfcA
MNNELNKKVDIKTVLILTIVTAVALFIGRYFKNDYIGYALAGLFGGFVYYKYIGKKNQNDKDVK